MDPARVVELLMWSVAILAFSAIYLWICVYQVEDRGCPQCQHCREAKLKRDADTAARRKAEAHQMAHARYGERYCPYCITEKEDR